MQFNLKFVTANLRNLTLLKNCQSRIVRKTFGTVVWGSANRFGKEATKFQLQQRLQRPPQLNRCSRTAKQKGFMNFHGGYFSNFKLNKKNFIYPLFVNVRLLSEIINGNNVWISSCKQVVIIINCHFPPFICFLNTTSWFRGWGGEGLDLEDAIWLRRSWPFVHQEGRGQANSEVKIKFCNLPRSLHFPLKYVLSQRALLLIIAIWQVSLSKF